MTDSTLLEHAQGYIDGTITLQQLHVHLSDRIVSEFRCGEGVGMEASFANFLVATFAEYELDRSIMGNSNAELVFHQELLRYVAEILEVAQFAKPTRSRANRTQPKMPLSRKGGTIHFKSPTTALHTHFRSNAWRQLGPRTRLRRQRLVGADNYQANKSIKAS